MPTLHCIMYFLSTYANSAHTANMGDGTTSFWGKRGGRESTLCRLIKATVLNVIIRSIPLWVWHAPWECHICWFTTTEAFSWCSVCDPESTMGVSSEMLLQMKQNVINNPLVEDVPALQSRVETAVEMQWYNKVRHAEHTQGRNYLLLVGPSVDR